jgi:hypothetical protein
MLEIRPVCENCGSQLPNDADNAMICTFECTYCKNCVDTILKNVCPNCGGGFEKRPTRPKDLLKKYPIEKEAFLKPLEVEKFKIVFQKYKDISPRER